MKKYLILFIFFLITNTTYAQDVIYSTEDGIRLKCIANRNSNFKNILTEYSDPITDYYEFRNGKLYSDNLSKMFGRPKKKPKKVSSLTISSKYISFKDRLWGWGARNYKWVNIERKTGKYYFTAQKEYQWIYYLQKINANGFCTIENNQ